MPYFFALMILIGLALAWNKNDDVWFESILAGWRGRGVVLIVVGIIGLVCLWVSPGLAQEHHPLALHEKFYSTWMQPDNPNVSCCHNDDCSPAASKLENGKWYARSSDDQPWIGIPAPKIEQKRDSPDGRSHLCGRRSLSEFTVFCFVRGNGA